MTITVSANNGTAPASALATIAGTNGDGTPHTTPVAVAASYERLRSSMLDAGMGDLLPTDGWSCYRDRAAQQHMRDLGLTTIPVGQSIHGEWSIGSAVDFQGLGGFGAPRHDWLRANAALYGWYQPGWAQAGGSLPEPWHWEYDERNDERKGDDMPSADEVARAVWDYTIHGADPRTGAPWSDGAAAWLRDARVDSQPDYAAGKVWAWPVHGADPLTGAPWSDVASAWLRDGRSDARVGAHYSQATATTATSATSPLSLLALVLVAAVILGLAVAALSGDVELGAFTGSAAAVNGVIAVIAAVAGRRDR